MARLDDRGTSFFFPVAAPPPPTLQTKAVVVEEAATSRTASLTTDYCRAKTTRHLCTGTSLHFFIFFFFPFCSHSPLRALCRPTRPRPASRPKPLILPRKRRSWKHCSAKSTSCKLWRASHRTSLTFFKAQMRTQSPLRTSTRTCWTLSQTCFRSPYADLSFLCALLNHFVVVVFCKSKILNHEGAPTKDRSQPRQ